MPTCGSQIVICDLPIRFDTYFGCTHQCKYCFAVKKNYKMKDVQKNETHKRLIDIINPTSKTVDALMRLELPSGVDVEIKV